MKKKKAIAEFILVELFHLADQLDVEVRREKLGDDEAPADSGLVVIEGRAVIFLDRSLDAAGSVAVMVRELSGFPMEDIYLKPAIRDLFEKQSSGG